MLENRIQLKKGISRFLSSVFMFMIVFTSSINSQEIVINSNGGFESTDTTSNALGVSVSAWSFEVGGGGEANFAIVNDSVKEGTKALRINVGTIGINTYDIQAINTGFEVKEGVTYTYSVWAKASSGGGTVSFTAGNPSFQEFGRLDQQTISEEWQEFTFTFTVGADDTQGRAPLHLSYDANVGESIWIDGLTITKPEEEEEEEPEVSVPLTITHNINGSFERSDTTSNATSADIEGWTLELQDVGGASFSIVDDEVKDGNRALRIDVTTQGENQWSIQAINEPFDVEPGLIYSYSVWAKASGSGTSANFTVGNPSFNEFGRLGDAVLTEEWQEFTLEFEVPAGNTEGRAPLHFSFAGNVGESIWIDSLRITTPNSKPLIVEAESGSRGSEFDSLFAEGISYVSTTTDYNETTGDGLYPGANRLIEYEVTFPSGGLYDLFVRLRVGDEGGNDDSFFYGNGFGEKDPVTASDWIVMNGLDGAGFTNPDDIVRVAGNAGNSVWKWINISRNGFAGGNSIQFEVEDTSLTKTFYIGARENGLDIDKFAFAPASLFYTVSNLDNVEDGSETDPTDVGPKLIPIAEGKPKFLGNIYSSAQEYRFEEFWNQVTPENAGKWGSIEGTRDQMNWGGMDAAAALAEENGYPLRFHVLVWGRQQPTWMKSLSDEEQLEEIREWFEAVAERYPQLDWIEVVNEPLHDAPDQESSSPNTNDDSGGYVDALGGTGSTGWDWVIKSFEMAREIFPSSVKLMINDYGILNSTNNTNTYLQIINLLKDRGLIDIIGVQGHAFTVSNANSFALNTILDRLAETDLPIQVTELDIDGNPNGTDAQSDKRQLEEYQRIFPELWKHPSVMGVTLWGWRTGHWRTDQDAFIIRENEIARPALDWIRAYVDTAQVQFLVSNEQLSNTSTREFKLNQNYPNPFNPSTQISYEVPKSSEVSIDVYDVTGRFVQNLVNTRQTAGSYTVTFNASNLSSGVYIYRLKAGEFIRTKKMLLIK